MLGQLVGVAAWVPGVVAWVVAYNSCQWLLKETAFFSFQCGSLENMHFKEHQEDAMRSSGKWNGTLSITLNTNKYFSVGA